MKRFLAAGSFVLFVALLMLLLASTAAAQEGSKTSDPPKTGDQPTEGIDSGNYNIQQTAELAIAGPTLPATLPFLTLSLICTQGCVYSTTR